jgi:hypothetical protein
MDHLRKERDERKRKVRAAFDARVRGLSADIHVLEREMTHLRKERDEEKRLVRAEIGGKIKALEEQIHALEAAHKGGGKKKN